MEESFVEEAAASLVREFLSKKGLKKTSTMMDKEFPRTALSINNRNELQNVLHLQPLCTQNMTRDTPFKSILEVMACYFLERQADQAFLEDPSNKARNTDSLPPKNFLYGKGTRRQTVAEKTKKESYEISEGIACLPKRHCQKPGEKARTMLRAQKEGEKKLYDPLGVIQIPAELTKEARMTLKEKPQGQTNLLPSQGKMAASADASEEDFLKGKNLKLLSGICSPTTFIPESGLKSSTPIPGHLFKKTTIPKLMDEVPPARLKRLLHFRQLSSPKSPSRLRPNKDDPAVQYEVSSGDEPLTKAVLEKPVKEKKTVSGFEKCCLSDDVFQQPTASEYRSGATQKNEASSTDIRKSPIIASRKDHLPRDILELVDVEDEENREDIVDPKPVPSTCKVTTTPMDYELARDLKILIFGSSFDCFSEEWKIQSFTFDENPQLKYGIVQKKGGPCGVLAAVQAHVLQHLIFGDSRRNTTVECLRPSDTERTQCLVLALAGILWRAGGNKKVVLTLASRTQQFTPFGHYRADWILEMLVLYFITSYEDLLTILQQNIHQFEVGPYGCVLLTLSAILSRSIDRIREDVDVITYSLIVRNGYCTQELVNLILTGKAVSNVFNDVVELDTGNGNINYLKGISSRSDLGVLTLFEHYEVTEVGCYFKTPRFPIWVVFSESHFSVLFSLRKDLVEDWRTECQFDLYYYDGLANQQEEIRLTIDTTQPYVQKEDGELIPPLEHCIRTKWKGAVINWNGVEPIL